MTRPPHHGTPPRPAPATLSQVGWSSRFGLKHLVSYISGRGGFTATAAVSEREEQRHKAKENLDVGAAVTVFGIAVLLGGLFLPKEAKQPGNNREGPRAAQPEHDGPPSPRLGGHRTSAKCLVAACAVLSVLTLLSLLALLPGGVYLYIGLSVVTAVTLSAAGAHWWLLRRMNNGGGGGECRRSVRRRGQGQGGAGRGVQDDMRHHELGVRGPIGVLFSASKISGAAAGSVESAAHAAIFFTFTTAILGVFVLTVSKVVTNQRRRCSRRRPRHRHGHEARQRAPALLAGVRRVRGSLRGSEEARIKALEDIASKVTAATLGGIMSILGGALGEEDRDKWGSTSTGVLMVVLTSAFVSGFGFMVPRWFPGSATAILAPVARVLVWSTVALFTGTAVAVYGVEVSGLDNPKEKP
ncbi:unnamed protein product [Miscanthus lutarioriparius]|uniref:Uncharacterized protein n=1 Tax=Miscanthus lutarioriparius TaxID=422564 RepID=A0A811SI48_9POAL|nr:unnamed protein product [Miscanthus lutarioriparius]